MNVGIVEVCKIVIADGFAVQRDNVAVAAGGGVLLKYYAEAFCAITFLKTDSITVARKAWIRDNVILKAAAITVQTVTVAVLRAKPLHFHRI